MTKKFYDLNKLFNFTVDRCLSLKLKMKYTKMKKDIPQVLIPVDRKIWLNKLCAQEIGWKLRQNNIYWWVFVFRQNLQVIGL